MLIYKRACSNGVMGVDWPIALSPINAICTPLIAPPWGPGMFGHVEIFPACHHRRIA